MPAPPPNPNGPNAPDALNAPNGPNLPAPYAARAAVKSPNRIVAEAEQQWLFSLAELANTPSIQDGMSQAEEKAMRAKGVNFIVQVGIMLKLPQLTLSTAATFFQRFLMRASLKKERHGIPKLHHYQTAATALFLATKVEESCRKMRELILAFCRVAQKNPNLIIDEQSKDWWRWRDCILHNEDVLLEVLCFDLTVESPHKQLFEMLKYYGVEHNKRLRNAAWAFVTDSSNTMLCLLSSSRVIAVASLYAACRYHAVSLPDDSKGRPWWETQHVRLNDVKKAVEYMCANYEAASNKGADGGGNASIYVSLSTSMSTDGVADDGWDSTRLKDEQGTSPFVPSGSERRTSNASSVGIKRDREEGVNGGGGADGVTAEEGTNKRLKISGNGDVDTKVEEEKVRVENGNEEEQQSKAEALPSSQTMPASAAPHPVPPPKAEEPGEVSEEGELEE